ncbi:hypothetical protein SDC9_133246 [bioreactor metagenome]|uniref:Cysteinyl-tRNA synthetase class Ia DALR domain-containing protein n=1 Tax=bioreactor metagenome TaxID=1076179 RepID=A0A645DA48_9ZZZZ
MQEVKVEVASDSEREYLKHLSEYKDKYIEKMDDDFNTADGISVIFDMIRDMNTNITTESSKESVNY